MFDYDYDSRFKKKSGNAVEEMEIYIITLKIFDSEFFKLFDFTVCQNYLNGFCPVMHFLT